MIKEIADELKREGQGRFKQLLDTAGLYREAEDVLKMFITKEPWECTTDVELKVIKAPKLRSGDSRYFQMNSHPRGRAIIFVTTDGLDVEINRWHSIFGQNICQYRIEGLCFIFWLFGSSNHVAYSFFYGRLQRQQEKLYALFLLRWGAQLFINVFL